MRVLVTDLCGREAPHEADTCDLEEGVSDALYEFSCETDSPWFVGEYQFDEIETPAA